MQPSIHYLEASDARIALHRSLILSSDGMFYRSGTSEKIRRLKDFEYPPAGLQRHCPRASPRLESRRWCSYHSYIRTDHCVLHRLGCSSLRGLQEMGRENFGVIRRSHTVVLWEKLSERIQKMEKLCPQMSNHKAFQKKKRKRKKKGGFNSGNWPSTFTA